MLARVKRSIGRVRWSVVWDTYDVFVRAVEREHADFAAPDGYDFGWAEPHEVLALDRHHTELDRVDREHGAKRLEIGHRLVVARHGDQAVFTMWVNPRNLNVPHYVKRRLDPSQVFIYKAYTSPEHRGRKLYQAGMRFVLADLAARGMRELVGYAARTKAVSRAGLDRVGFSTRGSFRGYGYGTPQLVRCSPELVAAFPERVARTGLDLT